jgi:hypothetical protein
MGRRVGVKVRRRLKAETEGCRDRHQSCCANSCGLGSPAGGGHRTWSLVQTRRQDCGRLVASSSIALINHTVSPSFHSLVACPPAANCLLCLLPTTWLRVFDRSHRFPKLSAAASFRSCIFYLKLQPGYLVFLFLLNEELKYDDARSLLVCC